jgi:hypothetical protein
LLKNVEWILFLLWPLKLLFCCCLCQCCRRPRRQEEETPGGPEASKPSFLREFNKRFRRLRKKKYPTEKILNGLVKLYRNKEDAI